MKRGDLFRVRRPGRRDPKKQRVFVVASREALIQSRFSTVICAPVYSKRQGIATEVFVGVEEGLRHESAVVCDALASLPKSSLTNYVGSLSPVKMREFDDALRVALAVEW